MTPRGASPMLRSMPDKNPIRLELELATWPEPVAGSLRDAHGRTRTFHGWLGLAAALEALAGSADGDEPAHDAVQA
jgi:hypothetical protein